jgi:hypothetical protein
MLVEALLREKAKRRRAVALLPAKEKVRILIRLQREANEIRRKRGRPELAEWPED